MSAPVDIGANEAVARAQARAFVDAQRAKRSLMDFVPWASPRYVAPKHLQPFVNLIERAERGERVLAVVSAPPRHGKTEIEVHAIPWMLRRDPAKQIAFIGYAARFAEKKSRKAREIAKQVGVPLANDSASKQDWRTGVEDGGVWATSIGGQLTGEGFHMMLVDDPVKDRRTAESPVYREHIYDWFNDTAFTRLEPKGSCIVTQTRWHTADLAGRLIADGWENVRLPAIDDKGNALWPERWPVERLRRIQTKLGEYGWASLYQGQPFPRGGKVFRDACFYEGLLEAGFRVSIGADFAYSEKSRADYSTIVVLAELEGDYYVLDVYRERVESPKHAAALRLVQLRYGVPVHAYIGGTELGVVSFMGQAGVRIRVLPARGDKFSRAQPVAAAWNAKKILMPVDAPWLDAFLEEFGEFTGVRDRHDDLVDALAAAFDALDRPGAEADVTVISA